MLFGPKGLSSDQIAFWEKSMAAMTQTAEWRQYVQQVDGMPAYRGSRELSAFLDAEHERYRAILGELGLAK
jgi:putative tricarboxylic transport membrane protein